VEFWRENRPAWQIPHVLEFCELENLPAEHSVQELELLRENEPAGQVKHPLALASEYLPPSHTPQKVEAETGEK